MTQPKKGPPLPDGVGSRRFRFAGDGPWSSRLEVETQFARLFDIVFPPHTEYDTHRHEEGYLCLILDGGYDEWPTRGGPGRLTAGSHVTYPAGSGHATRTGPSGARILHVAHPRSPALVERLSHAAVGVLWQLGKLVDDRAGACADDADALHLACLTSELWAESPSGMGGDAIDAVRDVVRDGVGRSVTLGEIARAVGRHPSHVARAFRARWGMTVGEYLRRTRVAEAIRRLRTTGASLSTVAFQTGVADQSHMGRWVRRYTGLTPLSVREGRPGAGEACASCAESPTGRPTGGDADDPRAPGPGPPRSVLARQASTELGCRASSTDAAKSPRTPFQPPA